MSLDIKQQWFNYFSECEIFYILCFYCLMEARSAMWNLKMSNHQRAVLQQFPHPFHSVELSFKAAVVALEVQKGSPVYLHLIWVLGPVTHISSPVNSLVWGKTSFSCKSPHVWVIVEKKTRQVTWTLQWLQVWLFLDLCLLMHFILF